MGVILSSAGFKRVIRTWLQAFVGLMIPGLLGWLNDLTEWARSEGQAPFPDAKSLAYIGVVAISSSFIALIALLQNSVEDTVGKGFLRTVPTRAARGVRNAAGQADLKYVLTCVFLVLAIVVLLAWLL